MVLACLLGLAEGTFTAVRSRFLQELAKVSLAVPVLAMGSDFCVYTLARVQNFEVVWIGKVRIVLGLAERDYLVVFAFAFFRTYVFFNDIGHWNLLFDLGILRNAGPGTRAAYCEFLALDVVNPPADLGRGCCLGQHEIVSRRSKEPRLGVKGKRQRSVGGKTHSTSERRPASSISEGQGRSGAHNEKDLVDRDDLASDTSDQRLVTGSVEVDCSGRKVHMEFL